MIINLRYHIASLVAVFLALGIGILIGSTMLGNDTLVKQQKQLTDRIEAQLELLQKRNEAVQVRASSLEMDNNVQRQFEKQVMPVLISGKLQGHSIAIIETNGYGFLDDLIQALQMSGAKVQSVTTLINGLEVKDKGELLSLLNWPDMKDEELTSRLAKEIAKAVVEGDSKNILANLAQAEVIRTEGVYGGQLSDVIIIGGSADESMIKTRVVDIPIIDYLQTQKVKVFGVEHSGVSHSYMKDYQSERISTVDNVDTIPGQVALVLAVSGKPGHYGIKSTAQKLLPSLEDTGGVTNVKKKPGFSSNTRS